MVDGMSSRTFSADTLPPPKLDEESRHEILIKLSRERYAVAREIVEDKIKRWSETRSIEKGGKGEYKKPFSKKGKKMN